MLALCFPLTTHRARHLNCRKLIAIERFEGKIFSLDEFLALFTQFCLHLQAQTRARVVYDVLNSISDFSVNYFQF